MNLKFQGWIVPGEKVFLIKLLTPLEKQSRESDPMSEFIIRTAQIGDLTKLKESELKSVPSLHRNKPS